MDTNTADVTVVELRRKGECKWKQMKRRGVRKGIKRRKKGRYKGLKRKRKRLNFAFPT